MKHCLKILLFMLVCSFGVQAKGQYLSQDEFLAQTFPDQTPQKKSLWLKGEFKEEVKALLGHHYGKIRIKYWTEGERTAWILEQIGKEKPITAGFLIQGGKIQQAHVLAFRESRGWEIRRKAFTRQFEFAQLTQDNRLTQQIDGITGATLSVNAMNRMAKLALRLHEEVQHTLGQS